jgi:hypothetical protein
MAPNPHDRPGRPVGFDAARCAAAPVSAASSAACAPSYRPQISADPEAIMETLPAIRDGWGSISRWKKVKLPMNFPGK